MIGVSSASYFRAAAQASVVALGVMGLPNCGADSHPDAGIGNPPPSNFPPRFQNLRDQTAYVGQLFNYRLTAYDPDGDSVGFSLGNAPDSGNPQITSDGLFTWTPTRIGRYGVQVFIGDRLYSVPGSFTINVIQESAPPPPPPPPTTDAGMPPVDSGVGCFRPIDNSDNEIRNSVALCGGTYTNARLRINSQSGIRVLGGSFGAVVFQLTNSSVPGILVNNSQNIQLGGFQVEAAGGGVYPQAISISNSTEVSVAGGRYIQTSIRSQNSSGTNLFQIYVDSFQQGACIYIYGGANHSLRQVQVEHCGAPSALSQHAIEIDGTINTSLNYVFINQTRNGVRVIRGGGGTSIDNSRFTFNGSATAGDAMLIFDESGGRIQNTLFDHNSPTAVNVLGSGNLISGNTFVAGEVIGNLGCDRNMCR